MDANLFLQNVISSGSKQCSPSTMDNNFHFNIRAGPVVTGTITPSYLKHEKLTLVSSLLSSMNRYTIKSRTTSRDTAGHNGSVSRLNSITCKMRGNVRQLKVRFLADRPDF